jgi:hypothetical protein
MAASLTVTFTVTGTATNGTDYQGVPLSVTFTAGQALRIPACRCLMGPQAQTGVVTVTDDATYDVGAPVRDSHDYRM